MPTKRTGPDDYRLGAANPLARQHALISDYLAERGTNTPYFITYDRRASAAAAAIVAGDAATNRAMVLAIVQRMVRLNTIEQMVRANADDSSAVHLDPKWQAIRTFELALQGALKMLLRKQLPLTATDLDFIITWLLRARWIDHATHPVGELAGAAERLQMGDGLPEQTIQLLTQLAARLRQQPRGADVRGFAKRIERLVGLFPDIPVQPGEVWSDRALSDLSSINDESRAAWRSILDHCATAGSGVPSRKWMAASAALIERLAWPEFRERMCVWLPLIQKPRATEPPTGTEWEICDENADLLRALAFCCAPTADTELASVLGTLAVTAFRKLPGIGPRLVRVGNACIWALGAMPGRDGLGQLAFLKVRVKFGTAQRLIEKALTTAAERIGLPRDEIEELAVPTYGLGDLGLRRETLGDYTAELAITGTSSTELRWRKSDGRLQKSVPAAVKTGFADDLKELKQAAKDIQKMLPAQRERLDQLFLARKSWPYPVWRERYLNHPLVGTLARRLIWTLTRGQQAGDAIFSEGHLVDHANRAVDWPDGDTRVELWHPIGRAVEDVLAWRRWLEEREVRQPFKQAHREIYVLTDAERQTDVYSNRFAAHILRQHQFNALCAARGWKNTLRLLVDDEFPPATRLLPAWNLRAEFWIEGIGDDYDVDTTGAGSFLRVSTDQVRFYALNAAEHRGHASGGGYYTRGEEGTDTPIALEQIPPLVFSEVMRDVDLFVGVASLGNDPAWADGGPNARYLDYWRGYAFGELGESAKTRRQVLERLIPRLKIAERCSFAERFLVVRGDLRTYKIHLGSGNILMEPNDEYLCIVPGRSQTATDKLYLPFEGDQTLAVILSKALLLAADKQIKDPTIVRQIG